MTTAALVQMIDIRSPEEVQVVFSADRSRMWVNVDGICRLRIYDIPVNADGIPALDMDQQYTHCDDLKKVIDYEVDQAINK